MDFQSVSLPLRCAALNRKTTRIALMQIKFSALTVLRFGDASRPEWQPRYHSQALGSKMQSPVETMLRVLQYARVEAE